MTDNRAGDAAGARPSPGRPAAGPPAEQWFAALANGVIPVTTCGRCGRREAYAKSSCTRCLGTDLSHSASSGVGSVYSLTTVHRPPAEVPPGRTPYTLGLVELDDCDGRVLVMLPNEAAIGCRVQVTVDPAPDPPVLSARVLGG